MQVILNKGLGGEMPLDRPQEEVRTESRPQASARQRAVAQTTQDVGVNARLMCAARLLHKGNRNSDPVERRSNCEFS